MYSKSQVENLFALIHAVNNDATTEGCEPSLTTVDTVALHVLVSEAKRLAALEQELLIGEHEHCHGTSLHLFLVPKAVEFGKDELAAHLGGEYEPDRDEWLSIGLFGEPVVVGASAGSAPQQQVAAPQEEAVTAPAIAGCGRCGGEMRPGVAMGQTVTGVADFVGADDVVTMSPGGPGRLIPCSKCGACGHSVTAAEAHP